MLSALGRLYVGSICVKSVLCDQDTVSTRESMGQQERGLAKRREALVVTAGWLIGTFCLALAAPSVLRCGGGIRGHSLLLSDWQLTTVGGSGGEQSATRWPSPTQTAILSHRFPLLCSGCSWQREVLIA